MVYFTQLIYVHAGREDAFHAFEDAVLPLLSKYGGELLLRLRPERTSRISGSEEAPYEIQVVRFATEDGLAAYANDADRQRALHLKEQSVRTSVAIQGQGHGAFP